MYYFFYSRMDFVRFWHLFSNFTLKMIHLSVSKHFHRGVCNFHLLFVLNTKVDLISNWFLPYLLTGLLIHQCFYLQTESCAQIKYCEKGIKYFVREENTIFIEDLEVYLNLIARENWVLGCFLKSCSLVTFNVFSFSNPSTHFIQIAI